MLFRSALVQSGAFREDLFFRLKVVEIHLPPLRERKEDIPLLAQHFLREAATENGKDVATIAPEALELLLAYAWPGNVRELRTAIEHAVVFARGILCNARVCLAVWLAMGGRTVADRIAAIVFPITAFVTMGFEHSIANGFFLPYGAALASAGAIPLDAILRNQIGRAHV